MKTWTPALEQTAAAEPLTDAEIVRIGMTTLRRYRPLLGIDLSSKIAASKMRRLYRLQGGAR
ncbi:MAG: hypothetical protein HOU01_18295 [Streptomycetaceae bacterium]|nr:hypothetical protein [Streptomycetaceae bacterium]